ncbi:diguanylate cyclase [Roseateles saccharophilus]|nr:diguanylate cyclase [Roseateles saccharophilus]
MTLSGFRHGLVTSRATLRRHFLKKSTVNLHLSQMNEPLPRSWSVGHAVLLALVYAISGRVALLLALPPSYASAIFPPAGIALAFVLAYGLRVLPGVFFGSLLLNAWLDLSRGQPIGLDIAAPLSIAMGSTAQVVVGRLGLRRFLDSDSRFDTASSVLLFLLGAPIVCLTSASLSLAALLFVGAESVQALGPDWLTWWIGDTLGVVLCLPLTLLFIGHPRPLWRRRRLAVGLPVLISIGLCVAVYLKTVGWEQEQSLKEFQLATERTADELQTHLAGQEFVVEELAAFMSHAARGEVTRDEFRRFASTTLAKTPEVAAVEWVPCVNDAARAAFEAREARDMPGFQIKDRTAAGTLVRSARRDRYFPVAYVEPLAGNQAAVGFDLASNAVRREAVVLALKSGQAVASSPIELVQEQHKQKGLILVRAVQADSECPDLVLSVLRLGDFVSKSLPSEAAALDLHVDDLAEHMTVFGQADAPISANSRSRELHFGGRTYQLAATPTGRYLAEHKSWQSLMLLAGCLFGTGLLGALLLLSTGYTERTETVIRDRTEQLERESRKTAMFLRNSSDGTHIIDVHGRLVEVSDSFCQMLGYSRDELIGKRISDWDADLQPERVEFVVQARLENRLPTTFETRHRRKDGTSFDVEVSVGPIDWDGERYLFASSRNITKRKLTEQALRQSEHRLQSVTDRIPMRVSFIDNEERYRFVNPAYEATFGMPRAELLGKTVREVLGDGAYGQVAHYITRALAGETLSFDSEITTQEGYRCYRATYVPQTSDDGTVSGFVAIVLDTTRQKLEERRLIELSQLDSLTGLLNRSGLLQRGKMVFERSRETKGMMALMMLDVDGFKQVNDTLGHQVGDMLLRGFAGRLIKSLRANDIIARPGGDEFAVIVEGLAAETDASAIPRNLVEAMRAPFILESGTVSITTSIGVAVYAGQPDVDSAQLIKLADSLLYAAKRAGRNDFRIAAVESAPAHVGAGSS